MKAMMDQLLEKDLIKDMMELKFLFMTYI